MRIAKWRAVAAGAVLAAVVFPVPRARANMAEAGGVAWTYSVSGARATVTGADPAEGASELPERVEVPDRLGGYAVRAIGNNVFAGAIGVKAVSVPDSVTNIGKSVFFECTGLEEATLGGGVVQLGAGAFYGCTALRAVALPDGLARIGESAFEGCTALAEVALPAQLAYLGPKAFKACGALAEAAVPAGLASIGAETFYECRSLASVSLPDGLRRIEAGAFAHCAALEGLEFPAGLAYIGEGAFEACTALASVAVPDGVKEIAARAFAGCTGLAAAALGGGTEGLALGNETFSGCAGLAELILPDRTWQVGTNAFSGCSGLARLEAPGAWYGTDKLAVAGVPKGCEVVYRQVEPLAIETEELPAGTPGEAYEAVLVATGGKTPRSWCAASVYGESPGAGTYVQKGQGQGWQGDDECWDLALPFAFPFFGNTYTNAKINSNGAISFGRERFADAAFLEKTFLAAPIVAAMWTDLTTGRGDIYVLSGRDEVTVCWKAAHYGSGGAANFSATLRSDGTISLIYGDGNEGGGVVGLSAGDGTTAVFSAKSGTGSMANAGEIAFVPDSPLPAGFELTAAGVLRGTPDAAGKHPFTAVVKDATGATAWRHLVLAVVGRETGTTPVPVPFEWLAGYGLGDGTAEGYEEAANGPAENGRPVWECYVADLDPTAARDFTVALSFGDGKLSVSHDPAEAEGRRFVLEARKRLEGSDEEPEGEWTDVTEVEDPDAAGWRFFRAQVVLEEPGEE